MAAQRVALCADIISDIFEHLWSPQEDAIAGLAEEALEKRAALTSSAIACRSFTYPALQVLWRNLDSLLPLFSVLAPLRHTRVKASDDPEADYALDLNGEITCERRARFAFYSRFVRSINLFKKPRFRPALFFYLAEEGIIQPVLPMLRELYCMPSSFLDVGGTSLLGPSLRHLWLNFGCSERPDISDDDHDDDEYWQQYHAGARIVRALPSRAPALEELAILDCPYGRMLSPIGRLTSLRRLDLNDAKTCDASILDQLAVFKNLVKLELPDHLDHGPLRLVNGFASLYQLSLSASEGPDVIDFALSVIHAPRLHTLVIADVQLGHRMALPNAVGRFCVRCAHTLQYISIDVYSGTIFDRPSPIQGLLDSLLNAHNLQELSIYAGGSRWDITDDDLRRVGKHCVRLVSLKVFTDVTRPATTVPSVLGVVDLARACPLLVHLGLPDLELPPFPPEAYPRLSHGLQVLEFQESKRLGDLGDALQVAELIDQLFPGINIHKTLCTRLDTEPFWHQVLALLPYVRASRSSGAMAVEQ